MAMARTEYSANIEGENVARAKANELPISPKHSIEIARFIKNMTTTEARAYLADVVELKKAIPFKRFNRNVAHKRALTGGQQAATRSKPRKPTSGCLSPSRRTPSTSASIPKTSGSPTSPRTQAVVSGRSSRVRWVAPPRSAGRP